MGMKIALAQTVEMCYYFRVPFYNFACASGGVRSTVRVHGWNVYAVRVFCFDRNLDNF